MTQRPPKLSREKPCPICGYDLRAAIAGGRCPECGTPIATGRSASRIPWVHRRQTGRVRAYMATVWMVMRHPVTLAAEVDRPIVLRDARKFYWTSVLSATVIATALFTEAYLLVDDRSSSLPRVDDASFWIAPAMVLWDRWSVVGVLAAGFFLAMRATYGCYRPLMMLGSTKNVAGGRLNRLLLYTAAWLPVEASLLGFMMLVGMIMARDWDWVKTFWAAHVAAIALLGMAVIATFLIPTIALIVRHGRYKIARVLFMTIAFPVIAYFMMACSLLAVFWGVGYLVMAVRSMTL